MTPAVGETAYAQRSDRMLYTCRGWRPPKCSTALDTLAIALILFLFFHHDHVEFVLSGFSKSQMEQLKKEFKAVQLALP